MKPMKLFKPQRFFYLCILAGTVIASPALQAQDKIILKQGAAVTGEIDSITPTGNILIKTDQGSIPYPKANIQKIELSERPDYKVGLQAIDDQDYQKGIEKLKPLIDKFIGLDAPWVADGAGYLAEALAKTGKTFESEQLCDKIIASYSGGQYRFKGMIGKANTLIIRDKADDALKMLDEAEQAIGVSAAPDAKMMSILSDLNFVRAQAYLKKGDKAAALESFLVVSTIYYKPVKRAQQAQAQADQLRKDNPNLVVN
ncbi:MAG: hypothetical protein PHD76_13485 [Methylacidiphilales bacterium]|nr:hypothetical protein [Candidatus Methylacidiphilales bacterium]